MKPLRTLLPILILLLASVASAAQVTVYAQNATMNWDDHSAWATAPGGGGTAYTNPQNGATTFVCDLNGKTVTLNVDTTVDALTGSSGSFATSGTRTLTFAGSGLMWSGSVSSGVSSSLTLTVNGNIGSSLPYVFNVGGTLNLNGNITCSGSGHGVLVEGGTFNFNGSFGRNTNGSFGNADIFVDAGTCVWYGSQTLAAGQGAYIYVGPGNTLKLSTATTPLALSNYGQLMVLFTAYYCTFTPTVNGHTGTITNMSTAAQAAFVGLGAVFTPTGPTIPAAADVQSGAATFGYAGGLLTPSYATTATTQSADAATLTGTTLNAVGADTTVAFGASNGTAKSGAVYTAAQLADRTTLAGYAAGMTTATTVTFGSQTPVTGTLDLTTYTLKSSVVDASYVLTGHNNYSGGSAGSLTLPGVGYVLTSVWGGPATFGVGGTGSTPTGTLTLGSNVYSTASAFGASGSSITPTATTAASQLSTDQAAVLAAAAYILSGHSILSQAGSLPASSVLVAAGGSLSPNSVLVAAGGNYVDPANSDVWNGVAVGISPRTGTKRASSITNCSAANVKAGVTIDNVTGAYVQPPRSK